VLFIMTNPDALPIDAALVRRLLRAQFPQWADLALTPATPQGWDNRTFRLGATLSVRLPSAAGYIAQVAKEHRWLPFLAPQLPLPIPAPVAQGTPNADFPWPWSIYRWQPGATASPERIVDLEAFAATLAHFLRALQQIDPTDGPPPGTHNFYRGGPLTVYNAETRRAIAILGDTIDGAAATAVWEVGLATTWHGPPVWVHGDVAVANLLVASGRLSAVIDFGSCGVGDPACDLVIAWTLFCGASRAAFRAALPLDEATWRRGRCWALWKALITLVEDPTSDAAKSVDARRVIDAVLADHAQAR
jgi:aminoglycoside phosphotransferase (APT) family kinase protein